MLLDYEFCRKAVASLRGTDATLEDLFDQTAKAACRVRERIQGSGVLTLRMRSRATRSGVE